MGCEVQATMSCGNTGLALGFHERIASVLDLKKPKEHTEVRVDAEKVSIYLRVRHLLYTCLSDLILRKTMKYKRIIESGWL